MWIPDSDLKDDSMEMKVSVDYLKMLKASRKERLKKMEEDGAIAMFIEALNNQTEQRIEDSYVCDCELNYGGRCKHPEKYRINGCNEED